MDTNTIVVTGKTKISSHEETNPETGEVTTVNDYDFALVNVEVPVNMADNVEFYTHDRLCKLARAHEIVLLGNLIRSTLADSKGKDQNEKNAIAQAVIGDNYPVCLDARIKTPGTARVPAKIKRAIEARQTALTTIEGMLKKPYDKWSVKSQEDFNATYPIPGVITAGPLTTD